MTTKQMNISMGRRDYYLADVCYRDAFLVKLYIWQELISSVGTRLQNK